jgi:hypothetical protein
MVVSNLTTGSRPGVLHRNGNPAQWRLAWQHVVKAFFDEPRTIDAPCPELTVITWNSRPVKGVLEECLDRRGVPYITLGRRLTSWRNCYKLYLTADLLPRITTPYVMALDADDVLVVSPLQEILRVFRTFECDMVFGAEKQSWPDVESIAAFERSIALSATCHLNSGAWIGRTDACARLFKDALDEDLDDILAAKRTAFTMYDDQGLTRKAFRRHHPAAQLDYQCRIFQALFRVPVHGEVLIEPVVGLEPTLPAGT